MPNLIRSTSFTLFILAAMMFGPASARAELLFAGDDGDDNGTEIWEFDISAGGWTKTVFCDSIQGVNGLNSDGKGNVYEADCGSRAILKFTPDGDYSTFASLDSVGGASAFDREGNLFVPFPWARRIDKISPDGSTSSVFTTNVTGPVQVVFDSHGELFAADQKAGYVYKFDMDGNRTTVASGLRWIIGLAFDHHGTLFVADSGRSTIYKFAPDGTRTTFAAHLKSPSGLAFDRRGNLFVSDGRGGIYKFKDKNGRLSTKPVLFATGLKHDYFITIMPGSMPFWTLFSMALARLWMWLAALAALAAGAGVLILVRRKRARRAV